jgi:predicted dehydrogenase
MSPSPLRIGVLGCANIARAFIRDVAASPAVAVVAVASRNADKAAAFARETGVARSHGSYEALLADPAVDAIYLPLPNSLHAAALRAADAGKHVLCEKPLADERAPRPRPCSTPRVRAGVILLEAYPYWFQPQTGTPGRTCWPIGRHRHACCSVQASFGFTAAQPGSDTNIRHAARDLGGGALLDAGSYAGQLHPPGDGRRHRSRVSALAVPGGAPGVDLATTATLDCGTTAASAQLQLRHGRRPSTATPTVVGSDGVHRRPSFINHTADAQRAGPPLTATRPSLLRLRRGAANRARLGTVPAPAPAAASALPPRPLRALVATRRPRGRRPTGRASQPRHRRHARRPSPPARARGG